MKLKLFLAVQSAGHSISKDHDRGYIEVEGKPIDSLLEQVKVQHVDWIKTDVEGADFEVIQGLRDTLTRHSPRVIVEVWNRNTLALLKDLDYMITPISSPSSYYFCVKRA